MFVDKTHVLTDLMGRPLLIAINGEEKVFWTVGNTAIEALMGAYEDERSLSGVEKFKRYQLAQRIQKAEKDVNLEVEDWSLIKLLVGKRFDPIIVGPFYEAVDPKESPSNDKA